ncbi:MAG: AI-2E family transporter [Patescibacteria group bacterium]
MITKVEISHKTIVFTLLLLASIWFILQIGDLLLLLFISFILMSGLRPLVDGLERKRVPRIIAILLIYIVVFGFLGGALAGIVPALGAQSGNFVKELPLFINRTFPAYSIDFQSILGQIAPVGENLLKFTVNLFSNIIAILTLLTFTFYFLLERKHLQDMLIGLLGAGLGTHVFGITTRVEKRLSAWVLGQLVLMLFIGGIVYIGLFFLGIEFAIPLAVLAGLLEMVPTVGPILSAVPAILVAFSHSPVLALSVLALYIIVQQVENNILVPLIMKRSVGLSPVLTILALMIGGRFAGIAGAILAVPILLTIQEIIVSGPNVSETKDK